MIKHKITRNILYFGKFWYRTTCSVSKSVMQGMPLYMNPDFSVTNIKNWHELCENIKIHTNEFQESKFLKIFPTGGFLYHNDLSMIDKLVNEFGMNLHDTIEVVTKPKSNAVYLAKSNYNYRSYFINYGKSSSTSNEEKLRNYLLTLSEEEVRLSPSLSKWANRNVCKDFRHIRFLSHPNLERTMFIDHKDLQILTMIGLLFPECIRKTVDIVVDAE